MELGTGIEAIGGGPMTEEGECVGVKGGRQAVGFEGGAEMLEVQPGRIGRDKAAGDDFAGVIIEGEQEHGFAGGGPPGVNGGVVLPEFAQVGALPAPMWSVGGWRRRDQMGQVRLHVSGHRGTSTHEVKAADQLVGDQLVIGWTLKGQKLRQELLHVHGPRSVMVAAGSTRAEVRTLPQPGRPQLIEAACADAQVLGGGGRVQVAGVEVV